MTTLTRFGISIDPELLEKFDTLIDKKGYANRSEAIRDLIRANLVDEEWADSKRETVGTITLVYNHHARALGDKLIERQHSHHEEIISTLHVHLDKEHCLEVIVIKGTTTRVRRLAAELIGTKGVIHGKLVTTTTGSDLT